MNTENRKVFINGMFSLWLQYAFLLAVFLISPIGLLLKDSLSQSVSIDIHYILRKFIFFLISFIVIRQLWVFKIATDANGISFYGFFKRVHASWSEVISIREYAGTNLGKVKTINGNFYIPLMMKEKDKTYPKFRVGLSTYSWLYEDGTKEKIALANCPLYIEIQRHYKQYFLSKTFRSDEVTIVIFLITPLFLVIQSGLLYFLAKNWIRNDFNVVLFLAIMSFILTGFVVFIFILFRKYSTFKIVTDEKGIAFYGLFKKINARWEDVISVKKASTFLREKVALVKTRNGDFYFPLSIKDEQKLNIGMGFPRKPVTPENCPLYVEIQKHLGNK